MCTSQLRDAFDNPDAAELMDLLHALEVGDPDAGDLRHALAILVRRELEREGVIGGWVDLRGQHDNPGDR